MTSILWASFYLAWFASEVLIAVATRTGNGGGKVRDRGSKQDDQEAGAGSVLIAARVSARKAVGTLENVENLFVALERRN